MHGKPSRRRSTDEHLHALAHRLREMEKLMVMNFDALRAVSDKLVSTGQEVLDYIKSHPTGGTGPDDTANQAEVDRLTAVFEKVQSDVQEGLKPTTPPVV